MKIAITGIGGFLGAHLARFFSTHNEVIGISTSKTKMDVPVYGFEDLDRIENPEVIIHCHAAVASGTTILDDETLHQGNVVATQKIADRFPTSKHIYLSSVSVYGSNMETITENTAADPQTDYAKSKFEAEQIIRNRNQSVVIRLSSLYGPGMKQNTLIPNYVNQAIQHKRIEVWGTGERKQNYFHVDDAARMIQAVIDKDSWEHAIYLGVSQMEYANKEIAQFIAAETGAEIVHQNEDRSLSVKYDNTFTQNTLNWHPEMQPASAIKAYIAWRKKQY
ncbi:NAD-dependent epimerase/dehydratase family protein [Flavobacterium sp.]|uniref:NAD-dependent epimerase/dehydratase family protein n=1 Tax=Flavobacterium sp. TaxID=239 RepID=UPI0039E66904